MNFALSVQSMIDLGDRVSSDI